MDFGVSEEESALVERMRALGAEAQRAAPSERFDVLARGGALGLPIAKDYGGEGQSFVASALAFEALGASLDDGGVLLAAGAHLFGVAMMIERVGTLAQKQLWLPKLARGETIATVAATEISSGSDIGRASSVATRTADGVRLAGDKRYVTMAERAGLYFTVARDGVDGKGLTALLVPRGKGVVVGPAWETAGLTNAGLAPVSFEDVQLSEDALLGRAGAGLAVFQIAMTFERALVLAFRLGAMQRQLEEAIKFARTRKLGGAPITQHQAVSHRLARMKQRLEIARLMTFKACWELDRGGRAQSEAALAKWTLADAALESALDAVRLRGGEAFLSSSGLLADLDDVIGGTIHSGTSDVLATIVATWLGV